METDEAEAAARVGETVAGKYALRRLLGLGGMGAVYEAENTWTQRRVALKLMRSEYSRSPEAVWRFMQEARSAAQIAHPNIVDVLDMGEDEASRALFIVQEFLSGTDLRAHLDRTKRLAAGDALELIVPIMGALVAVHRRGVVHRDIKPENIFLARGFGGEITPKLLDFGISKVMNQGEALARTRTGVAIGTPYYMSPEQARGDRAVDERTDVWAIGALLFEALAGRVPFDAPTYNLLMLRVMTERPPLLRETANDVPAALAEIVDRALEPDLDKRHRNMATFLSAVLDWDPARTSGSQSLVTRHRRSISDLDGTPVDPAPQRTLADSDIETTVWEKDYIERAAGGAAVAPRPPFSTTMAVTASTGRREPVSATRVLRWRRVATIAGAAVFALGAIALWKATTSPATQGNTGPSAVVVPTPTPPSPAIPPSPSVPTRTETPPREVSVTAAPLPSRPGRSQEVPRVARPRPVTTSTAPRAARPAPLQTRRDYE